VPELDLLSIDEGLAALPRGAAQVSDADAVPLSTIISAASARLDQRIGCSVIRAVDDERHTPRRIPVLLRHWPVVELVSVAEDDVPLVAADTYLEPQWGVLRRVRCRSVADWTCTPGGVVVSYRAGRCGATADVDPRIKAAAQIVVRHMWEQDHTLGAAMTDQGFPLSTPRSFSVPKRALDLVADLVRPSFF